ncbi:hypothetical protein [Paenibacillus xylanexedens]|uniref:hypothetical protein n=1 Tax=Paenibacillus xylanexedens TaxID=528191 RepID=UPI001C92F273|nr:hypothetical protein [Paenibacillus xylanexedens]
MNGKDGIELFQYANTARSEPVRASDYGLQHMALDVDDNARSCTVKRSAGHHRAGRH